jgi:hypothetical protein
MRGYPESGIHPGGRNALRRVYVVIGIWFAVAGIATVAFGDPVVVRMQNPPESVVAGQPYVVNLLVMRYGRKLHGQHPVVTLHYASGGTLSFRATERGHDGVYRALVRAPLQGTYTYDVHVNGHVSSRGTLAAKLTLPQG